MKETVSQSAECLLSYLRTICLCPSLGPFVHFHCLFSFGLFFSFWFVRPFTCERYSSFVIWAAFLLTPVEFLSLSFSNPGYKVFSCALSSIIMVSLTCISCLTHLQCTPVCCAMWIQRWIFPPSGKKSRYLTLYWKSHLFLPLRLPPLFTCSFPQC